MLFPAKHLSVIIFIILWLKSVSSKNVNCDITVDISDGVKSGSTITKDGTTYSANDYFVDDNMTKGCVCKVKHCIRRCCDSDETLSEIESETLKCKFASKINNITEDLQVVVHKGLSLFHIFSAPERQICVANEEKVFRNSAISIDDSGSLLWDNNIFYYDKYCASNFYGELGVLLCITPDIRTGAVVSCMGMIISMPFLLATFLVYAILPDKNVHQRALMFYVLTLCLSYILLVTINLSSQLEPPWCEIIAYATLFFFMVSFFWMNIICFDIWYTFSGGRGFVGSKRTSERRRFLVYSTYAWGVPILHVILVFVLQAVLPETSVHNPGIGVTKCFIADGFPNLWYFYGEAAILVIANMTFFLCTALKIRQVKKETSMLKQNDSKRHAYEKDKQKFNLYLKLLLAMGVNWSMEVISWLVNWQTNYKHTQVWYLTDFFNAVYGVFIFFIFVFKKKIWKLLQKRYYSFIGKPHLAHTMTSTNTRTSHYSSTNYSTADTNLTDRTNGARSEEMGLRRVT